jgi:hypothetical protein
MALHLGPYSQQFFFVTYYLAQIVRVLVPYQPFHPTVMKHSSLLVPSVSYKIMKCE